MSCTPSRVQRDASGKVYNEDTKHDRIFKAGVTFKDLEFNGQIGYVRKKVHTFTPSGLEVIPEEDEEADRPGVT